MVRNRRLHRRCEGYEKTERSRTLEGQATSDQVSVRGRIDDTENRRCHSVERCRQGCWWRKGLQTARRRRRVLERPFSSRSSARLNIPASTTDASRSQVAKTPYFLEQCLIAKIGETGNSGHDSHLDRSAKNPIGPVNPQVSFNRSCVARLS